MRARSRRKKQHLRRALFYDNVKWAVDYESKGLNKFADPDNVKLGQEVLKLSKSCLFWEAHKTPPQLRMTPGDPSAKNDGLLNRALLMYTVWNYRYVNYYTVQESVKVACENPVKKLLFGGLPLIPSKWAHVPHVILHTVGSLVSSLNLASPNLVEWTFFRLISLETAGAGAMQKCDGTIAWREPFSRTRRAVAKGFGALARKLGLSPPPGDHDSWNEGED